jgi:hypothetical protein
MHTPSKPNSKQLPGYAEHVESHIVRLYASIVLILLALGGLVWGMVTAVQRAPQGIDDGLFALLALGGITLAGAVLVLLAHLAQWAKRRVDW